MLLAVPVPDDLWDTYGTIEVAPAVGRELVCAFDAAAVSRHQPTIRLASVLWVGLGGLAVLLLSLETALRGGGSPPGLIALLTPANLFMGVLACGFICLVSAWSDRTHVPRGLRMGRSLTALNLAAGLVFFVLGIKAYWDHSQGKAFLILAGTLGLGWLGA